MKLSPKTVGWSLLIPMCSANLFGQQGMVNGEPTHYLNFESPQVKPITVASIDDTDYILACNTPDNSIEVYDVPGHTRLARIPVGLEPVSVVWSGVTKSLYACNFIGDSITKVTLSASPSGLAFTVNKTLYVGDEPMHCAVIPGRPNVLAVSLGSSSELAWLDADKLTLLANPRTRLDDLATPENIITDPRTVVTTANGAVLVLGGQSQDHNDKFQLYQNTGIQNGGTFLPIKDGFGNLNFNMTPPATRNGEVFVVSGQSRSASGEKLVATQTFGFVESLLTRFDNPVSPGAAALETRNLNQLPGGGGPVNFASAINQPMDVVAYEDDQGAVERVYVASFGTDRIAQVRNPGAAAAAWTITTVDIPTTTPGTIAGPRGLAISYGANGVNDDRIYVLCRLDNSIAYLDARTGTYRGRFDLSQDPTPDYIRNGRRFLYDSKLSGNGFNSCASCHIDGRTDQEEWLLSEHPGSPGFDGAVDLTSALVDGFADDNIIPIIQGGFEHDKGSMVTQSLQGLVNFETDPSNKNETTNAPYHWRADKIDFVAFGGAFRSLLLGPNNPADPRFVSEMNMQEFERFVNSIHYPPNPEQELDRRLSGSLGDPGILVDSTGTVANGSGSLLGLKAFHIDPKGTDESCAGRSCVQCHSLPEGSNNFMTQFFGGGPNSQALETPALRGVTRKDARVEPVGSGPEIGRAGSRIFHTDANNDLNDFVSGSFQTAEVKQGVIDFVRGLDTGTAPVVGRSVTIEMGGPTAEDLADIELFEDQALLANCEIAVEVWRNNGDYEGYWCDLANSLTVGNDLFAYRSEPPSTQVLMPHQLLTSYLGPQPTEARVVIFHAVPLGTSRRMASPTGSTSPLAAIAPTSLALGELTPNSAYEFVPHLTKNVEVPPSGTPATDDQFDWGAVSTFPEVQREPQFLQRLRILQSAAGMDVRHEAPRRIRVSGDDIAYGAVLELKIGASQQTVIKVPIYATGEEIGGKTVWTSAIEFEPLKFTPVDFDPATPGVGVRAVGSGYMSWLFGGPGNPSVDQILDLDRSVDYDEFNLPPTIDLDLANNVHEITVTNENGTSATEGLQTLSLSPPPTQIP